MKCSSCKIDFSAGVKFKCPSCRKETIARCGKCKKMNVKYDCKCGFEGP
ncbi:MAG: RNA-binding protein [Nanoarchaeota archaeon]|nr:RNA-binding protein [Nanoarchaeota archaeon]